MVNNRMPTWPARENIGPRYLDGAQPSEHPEAVLVVGQTGAGKSVVVESLCVGFQSEGHCVVIDEEELLWQHPEIHRDPDDAITEDELRYLRIQVSALADEIADAAIRRRLHIVIETRMGEGEAVPQQLSHLQTFGYRTTVVLLCVPPEISRASHLLRDEHLFEETGETRLYEPDMDRECEQLAESTCEILDRGLADHFLVIDRAGNVLWSAEGDLTGSIEPVADLLGEVYGLTELTSGGRAVRDQNQIESPKSTPGNSLTAETEGERSQLLRAISQMAATERMAD